MVELTKIIVAGASTVALAAGIGAGLAYADTPSEEPTTSPTAAAPSSQADTPAADPSGKPDKDKARKPFVRRQLRFAARALHGEVTLAGEEHRVIAFQRGEVQKVGQTSVTVKSNDGFVETYVLSDDTKVRGTSEKGTVSDIDESDRVLAVATKDGSTLNARRVIVRSD